LVAAKELGMKAVGIEIDERYCEMSVQRIQQSTIDLATEEV
jgi:DNA modification methylase